MPTEEQIRRWEVLEFRARKGDEYNYLRDRLPLDKDHEEWLQQRKETERVKEQYVQGPKFDGPVYGIANTDGGDLDRNPRPEKAFSSQSALVGPFSSQAQKKYQSITMHSAKNAQWYGMHATLDTGSSDNWISHNKVLLLDLHITRGLPERYATVDGSEISSCEIVKSTWSSEGRGLSYVTEFRVVRNAPFDVLFGYNLLCSEEINFFLNADPVLPLVGPKIKHQEQETINENIKEHAKASEMGSQRYKSIPQNSDNTAPKQSAEEKSKEVRGEYAQKSPHIVPY